MLIRGPHPWPELKHGPSTTSTPPAAVSALVVGTFGTDATGAAAIQAKCESQDDGQAMVKNTELGKAKAKAQAVAPTKLAAAAGTAIATPSTWADPTPVGLLVDDARDGDDDWA